jgi:WD40 repeat protein
LGNTYANGLDIARDGSRLAIGFDEALHVYDLDNFERTDLHGFDSIKAVAFNPDNSYLAAANIRGLVSLWNAAMQRQLATLTNPRRGAARDDLSFSADGTHLAVSNANSVHIWNLTSAKEKTVLTGHAGGIPCAAFHPDGQLLATGGKDDEVRLWDPHSGRLIEAVNFEEAVQSLAYSRDGQLLAVGCMGASGAPHLRLIDMRTKTVVHEAAPPIGQVHSLFWAQSSAGRRLAGCGSAGVALWEVPANKPLRLETKLELSRNWCLATVVDPAARFVVWAENDSNLKAWDVGAGRELPLHAPRMLQGWHGLCLLPDHESIIYVAQSGAVEVWNVAEDRHVQSIGAPGTFNAPHIALSADGLWLAALMQPDSVSIWHRPTGRRLFSLRAETDNVWSLAWDASGEHLAVGQSNGGLAVWHLAKIQAKLAELGLQLQPPP